VLAIPARVLAAGAYVLRIDGESLREATSGPLVGEYPIEVHLETPAPPP
jgi:hypothetical protein